MAQLKKLLTPVNIILAGLILFALAKFGAFGIITLAAVDLIDPETNATYSCNASWECYTSVSGQITGTTSGPALACINQTCRISYCEEGQQTTKTCTDGTKIALKNCVDGVWEFTDSVCVVECRTNSQCTVGQDTDCDGELNAVGGTCVSGKCSFQPAERCSDTQVFWGKNKLLIISLILIVFGLGGFLFKERLLKIF